MTVEEVRGNSDGGDRDYDNFPVGMRVLAVDGDPICLKLLECLLRKCQYHVTTTSLARTALKMLRENEDRFDLVITDVHMPDMDGFKLLELVGLELDLPVIMLSTNNDPKLVMKGVTHGACDYLVKPIRIEELRNIWQHVVRRKKSDSKKQSKPTYEDKALQENKEVCQGPLQSGNADQIGKLNKRKKDEEDEGEENRKHEDPATQKKPRVVWSVKLHRKFVAAVNQLGIRKAVPKRILDLMNVEGLTRVNVASHLQEYRLYLKRISSVASQQANMVAALGGLPTQQVPQQHTLQFNAQRPAQQSQHLDQLQTLPAEPLDSVNQPQPELFSSTCENVSQFRRLLRKITYGNESTSVNQVFSTGNESTSVNQVFSTGNESSVNQEFSTDTIETSLHLRL